MNRILLILSCAFCAVLFVAGCSGNSGAEDSSAGTVGAPVPPVHVNRSTPEGAVQAYLDGITFTYRMANSNAASDTMTAYEYVRVDAYVELNRQQGRALEQMLTAFEVRDTLAGEPTATVTTYEEWAYHYFSVETMKYVSDKTTASYDADYTVLKQDDGLWLVDKVDVTPLAEVN